MDVIDSGPERPVGTGRRRLRQTSRALARRLGPLGQRYRRTATVLGVMLVAAAGMIGLRAGLPAGESHTNRTAAWAGPLGPPYDQLPGRTPIPAPRLVSQDGQRVVGEVPVFAPAPSEVAARKAVDLVIGRYCRDPGAHSVQLVTPPRSRLGSGRFPGPGGGPAAGPASGPTGGSTLPTVPGVGPTISPTSAPTAPTPAPNTTPPVPTPTPIPVRLDPWQFAVAVVTSPSSGRLDVVVSLSWTGFTYRWSGSLAQLNACH
jgi:hypothetical protein